MASSVSLSPINSGKYDLTLSCTLDSFLRGCVNAVVERHQLKMNEQNGKILIYKSIHR